MRAREHQIMVEALKDLQEMPAWRALMGLAVEKSIHSKKQLLMSTSINEAVRIETVGRLQGVYTFFKTIADETKTQLPPKFTEHFTGENPDAKD